MQFVTSGNRIAVENFTVGYLYTITFTGGEYIHCACTGIGMDFVMFSRTAPEYTFALTMETAEDVSSIDLYSEGGGTTNYNDLMNKPQINGVELTGNKTSSDIGIQPLITADNKLSYTLVSGLGTAATTASSDYATAAQGALANSAVQPADMNSALNTKQNLINSDNMLSADLVDDTSTTNKFATAAELAQIETNKTNILYNTNQGVKNIFRTPTIDTTSSGINVKTLSDGQLKVTSAGTNTSAVYIDLETSLGSKYVGYKLSGGSANVGVYISNSGGTVACSVRGNEVLIPSTATNKLFLTINANTPAFEETIYVMIREFGDSTYRPYAMSNVELTEKVVINENAFSTTSMSSLIYNEAIAQDFDTNKILTYILSVYTDTDNEYVCAYGVYKHGVMHRCIAMVNNTITISAFNNLGTIALSGGTAPYYAKVKFF